VVASIHCEVTVGPVGGHISVGGDATLLSSHAGRSFTPGADKTHERQPKAANTLRARHQVIRIQPPQHAAPHPDTEFHASYPASVESPIILTPMSGNRVPGGVVHKLPADLREALLGDATALAAWKDITPLARNEFICWVEDAKQEATRTRRIRRTREELEEGQRRPCCWPGCKHRERTGR
jgi:Bacteriocin-protection, YdeI or OmpD-Associated